MYVIFLGWSVVDGAFPVETMLSLSRRRFPYGIALEREVRIDVSSAI